MNFINKWFWGIFDFRKMISLSNDKLQKNNNTLSGNMNQTSTITAQVDFWDECLVTVPDGAIDSTLSN